MSWSLNKIKDREFLTKFTTVPTTVNQWISDFGSLSGAHVLDFGCGEGITALGMALQFDVKRVVGVDIMPDPERCLPLAHAQLGLEVLPTNLELYRVEPGSLHDDHDRFDCVYSWSAFEHVDERVFDRTLQLLHNALKPGGMFFVQIAPLYFSAEGSHLFHKIEEPWGHLLTQHNAYYDKLAAVCADAEELRSLWSTYRTLNRIGVEQLLDKLREHHFEILRTYTTRNELQPPERLKTIYREDVLLTEQIVALSRKSPIVIR